MNKKQNKRIRKGDKVLVVAGNNRGQTGTVLSRSEERIIIQGINVRKKHMKKVGDQPGQIIELERPIHISNVRICTDEGKAVKVRVSVDEKGKRHLYYKDAGKEMPLRSV